MGTERVLGIPTKYLILLPVTLYCEDFAILGNRASILKFIVDTFYSKLLAFL